MTAQAADFFWHGDNRYLCIARTGNGLFLPKEYGFQPQWTSTACMRGYRCEYVISGSYLKLQKLWITDQNNHYPLINGASYSGHAYDNIDLTMPFTGKVLLANDFIYDYYVHLGFQAPHGYKILFSYEFDNGVLKEVVDHCNTAKMVREILKIESESPDIMLLRPYDFLPTAIRKTVWWSS